MRESVSRSISSAQNVMQAVCFQDKIRMYTVCVSLLSYEWAHCSSRTRNSLNRLFNIRIDGRCKIVSLYDSLNKDTTLSEVIFEQIFLGTSYVTN